jgi:hypothetical protein
MKTVNPKRRCWMRERRWLIVLALVSLLVVAVISCSKSPVEPEQGPNDAFIQKLIAYLAAYGGTARGLGEGGEPESTKIFIASYVESLYVDTVDEHGEHLIGYYYYDDGGTPWPNISDDLWGFRGTKTCIDYGDTIGGFEPDSITDRIWLQINVAYEDRRVISTGRNITEGHEDYMDSAYIALGKVDEVGGKQEGTGIFIDYGTSYTFELAFGLDHKHTPDYWDDNTAWMEFELIDEQDNCAVYLVHINYESWDVSHQTGHGGDGWIRYGGIQGALIATFEFDQYGWGWLTIISTGEKFRIYIG